MQEQEIDMLIQDTYFSWMGIEIGGQRIRSVVDLERAANTPATEEQGLRELARLQAAKPMFLDMLARITEVRKGQRIFNTDEALVIKSEVLTRQPFGDQNPYSFEPDFEVMTRLKDLLLMAQR